jgi:hypothetical protein
MLTTLGLAGAIGGGVYVFNSGLINFGGTQIVGSQIGNTTTHATHVTQQITISRQGVAESGGAPLAAGGRLPTPQPVPGGRKPEDLGGFRGLSAGESLSCAQGHVVIGVVDIRGGGNSGEAPYFNGQMPGFTPSVFKAQAGFAREVYTPYGIYRVFPTSINVAGRQVAMRCEYLGPLPSAAAR